MKYVKLNERLLNINETDENKKKDFLSKIFSNRDYALKNNIILDNTLRKILDFIKENPNIKSGSHDLTGDAFCIVSLSNINKEPKKIDLLEELINHLNESDAKAAFVAKIFNFVDVDNLKTSYIDKLLNCLANINFLPFNNKDTSFNLNIKKKNFSTEHYKNIADIYNNFNILNISNITGKFTEIYLKVDGLINKINISSNVNINGTINNATLEISDAVEINFNSDINFDKLIIDTGGINYNTKNGGILKVDFRGSTFKDVEFKGSLEDIEDFKQNYKDFLIELNNVTNKDLKEYL